MQNNNQAAQSAHRKTQSSTTLNRRYVRKPTKSTSVTVKTKKTASSTSQSSTTKSSSMSSAKISHFHDDGVNNVLMSQQIMTSRDMDNKVEAHPMHDLAKTKMQTRSASKQSSQSTNRLSAKELKNQAIKKALAEASMQDNNGKKWNTNKSEKTAKIHFGFGRVALALACAAAAVFAIAYFVNINMPDISLKVAAMQTGINASYPNYVPRDYSISSITSENGRVSLNFTNSVSGDGFVLTEETSSWDSNALMTNYVKESFDEDYSVIREQGLTIYVDDDEAAWVNGGVVYKLKITNGSLTNKQIRSIAASL